MAKRAKKKTEEQMRMFAIGGLEEGGLRDQGGSIDPVSGNDVPSGSTQSEVRDDIPAQLSEGEFVLPADVVRYIGLENLMELRNKAKRGLQQMENMGQMGNSDEAIMSDTASMEVDIDSMIDQFDPNDPSTMEFNVGGLATNPIASNPLQSSQFTPMYKAPTTTPASFASFVQAPAQMAAQQASAVTEQKEYIGPNGERITIPFVNGKEAMAIPEGYKPYDAEAEAKKAPKIVAPTVSEPVQGDSIEEREREKEDKDLADKTKETYNALARVDKDFAETWGKDPQNTGKYENVYTAVAKSLRTFQKVDSAIEKTAEELGIDLAEYTTGWGGVDSHAFGTKVNEILDARTPTKPTSPTGYNTITDDGYPTSSTGYNTITDDAYPTKDSIKETQPAKSREAQEAQDREEEEQDDAPKPDGAFFKKGGLASPKVKTKRKPKMKRGGLASKK